MKITFSHFSHIIIAAILFTAANLAGLAPIAVASDAPVQLEDLAKPKPADSDNISDEDAPLTGDDEDDIPTPPKHVNQGESNETPITKPNIGISDAEIRRLRESGEVPVTKPKSKTHKRRQGKITRKSVPTPGSMVINQTATVSRHPKANWMVATFEAESPTYQLVDMKLLPCRLLESIEEIVATKPDTRFVLSGEITVCKEKVVVDNEEVVLKQVYLLPMRVTIAKAPEPKDEAETTTKPVDPNEDVATTGLIGEMQTQELNTTVLVKPAKSRDAAENQESVAPAGKKPFESGKKTLVVDRIARIMKKDKQGWWEVRFKSDNTLREPPMRILPNKTFEEARGMTQTLGTRDLELRVSGIVTHYKGRRYLMIRKVLPERDMNEF